MNNEYLSKGTVLFVLSRGVTIRQWIVVLKWIITDYV